MSAGVFHFNPCTCSSGVACHVELKRQSDREIGAFERRSRELQEALERSHEVPVHRPTPPKLPGPVYGEPAPLF